MSADTAALADIEQHMRRLVANASFVQRATARGVDRALRQSLNGPSDAALGVPLRSLVDGMSLRRVPAAALARRLTEQRWAVLDDALPPELVHAASVEAASLLRAGALGGQPGLERLRQDVYSSLSGAPSLPSLSRLLRRLHGASRRLSRLGVLGAAPGTLVADPAGGQIACYTAGSRYAMHVDRASTAAADAASSLELQNAARRRATAIVYLRAVDAAEWSPDEAGELRLWPSSATTRSQASLLVAGSAIDVEPLGGRLVLFDSGLTHEVRPWAASAGHARCALTLWIHDAGGW